MIGRLGSVRRSGGGYSARCPAHDDRDPSLTVSEGDDGRALLHCHAGCTVESVLDAIGLTPRDLFDQPVSDIPRQVAEFVYEDEDGSPQYQARRHEPGFDGQRKSFTLWHPNGNGWEKGLGGARLVPYRLPGLRSAASVGGEVFVVEGEKHADALHALGLTATTNAMGAGKWRDEYAAAFAGIATVYVIPDDDDAGRRHADEVAGSLLPVVDDVRILTLYPVGETKRDLLDWLPTAIAEHGSDGARALLLELAAQAPAWAETDPVVSTDALRFVPLEEFASVEEPHAEPLVLTVDGDGTVIPAGGLVEVYGEAGSAKTTLMFDQAFAFAAGDTWCGTLAPSRPLRIAWIEDEGPRPMMRRKLERKLASWLGSPIDDRFVVLEEPWGRFTFRDERHRDELAMLLQEYETDVLVAGPVSRIGMQGGGTLDEVNAFVDLIADVQARCERPPAVVLIHHTNRAGQVSGAWEPIPDTLIHTQQLGHGRTRLHWQKARWASDLHLTSTHLLWAEGESFTVEEKPDVTEDTIAEEMIEAVREHPGDSWTKIRKHVTGNVSVATDVRDRLLAAGTIVNGATRDGYFNLWLSDDPAAPRSETGTAPERLQGGTPDGAPEPSRSTVPYLSRNGERNGTGEPGSTETETISDSTPPRPPLPPPDEQPEPGKTIDDDELERLTAIGERMGLHGAAVHLDEPVRDSEYAAREAFENDEGRA